jgi:hypothetical protein
VSAVLFVDAVGWLAAFAMLVAYALVSSGRLHGRSAAFQALNLFGALGLGANAAYHGAWPSASLNALWIVVGVVALARGPAQDVSRPVAR